MRGRRGTRRPVGGDRHLRQPSARKRRPPHQAGPCGLQRDRAADRAGLIMRSTEEALKSVPDSYREGSFGLGAGKLRTVFRIVLPSAIPGILAGVILAIGRIVGETAALIYTAGTVAKVPSSVFGSGRTLAVHMYNLSSEGLYMNQAYATAVVLLVLVVLINTISGMIAKRITKS